MRLDPASPGTCSSPGAQRVPSALGAGPIEGAACPAVRAFRSCQRPLQGAPAAKDAGLGWCPRRECAALLVYANTGTVMS